MEAHRVNGTWEIIKLPPGKHAIGSRWFMKVKYNADGSLDRYKARLVAKGEDLQEEREKKKQREKTKKKTTPRKTKPNEDLRLSRNHNGFGDTIS